jgi:hypothetical protein
VRCAVESTTLAFSQPKAVATLTALVIRKQESNLAALAFGGTPTALLDGHHSIRFNKGNAMQSRTPVCHFLVFLVFFVRRTKKTCKRSKISGYAPLNFKCVGFKNA